MARRFEVGGHLGFARWRSEVASGGNRYDDELAAALRTLGLDVREHPVTGRWPNPEPGDRQRFAELLTAEQEWLIDNIVASAAPEAIMAATAAGRRVTMLVHYFPADDPSLPPGDREHLASAEAAAIAAATTVVTSSRWAAREVATKYGRTDTIAAVPGVEPADLARGSAAGGDPPMLLWLARMTEAKDPLALVEALIRLRDLDWTARLVGPDTVDEGLSREVRDGIAAAGLADRIDVPGPRRGDALERIWTRADLLVHTARAETYGMVVSEALARGIPSLVPVGTGAVEAQRGAGGAFPAGDASALAEALRAWLTDPDLRGHWRAEAADRRASLPTWQDTARIIASALAR